MSVMQLSFSKFTKDKHFVKDVRIQSYTGRHFPALA